MKTQAYNIVFPKELMKKIDTAATRSYKSRSEYIRDLVASQLKEEEEWEAVLAKGREIGKKMGIKSEEDAYRLVKEYRREKYASKSRS